MKPKPKRRRVQHLPRVSADVNVSENQVATEYLEQETMQYMDAQLTLTIGLSSETNRRQNVQLGTKKALENALVDEWGRIPLPEIRTLIRSFRSRCRAVVRGFCFCQYTGIPSTLRIVISGVQEGK